MQGPIIGAMVCVTFAAVWAIVGATALQRRGQLWTTVLSVAISAALLVALTRAHYRGPAGFFRGGIYALGVGFEVVGIIAALVLLRRAGRIELILPVVGVIVGLHFIPMWWATGMLLFVWIAIAMCAVSGIALFLPTTETSDLRRVATGLGCAAVLWVAGATVLL